MIAGVVLAAGRGRRFGSQKLLAELDGRPLLVHAIGAAVRSRLDEVHVVIAQGDRAVEGAVATAFAGRPGVIVHTNPDPERGQMSSLKTALSALAGRAGAALVMLGDMPRVPTSLIDALIVIHERRRGIVIPVCGGEWRHPRVLPARLFDEFLALPDDARGTSVIARHDDDVVLVSGGNAAHYIDVDAPRDLELLHRYAGGISSKS